MSSNDFDDLIKFVGRKEYGEALAVCYRALSDGQDEHFWTTQLGYVAFLNEGDDLSYFNDAPSTFERLVEKYPEDVNAHFWLGYIYNVILNDIPSARKEMETCLQLSGGFPYACLVLSGLVGSIESINLLRRGLERQPNNYRMLRQLADILAKEGHRSEAKEVLSIILKNRAYIETNYGIMNDYINNVLTAASHELIWQSECRSVFDAMKI